MSPHQYTEANLVEQAAMEILADLGWPTANASDETFGPSGNFGRDSARDVALQARLRAALTRLNPTVPAEAFDVAIDDLLRDRSAMDLAGASREVHRLLTEGVKLGLRDPQTGEDQPHTVRAIDWEQPAANDFLAVRQMKVKGLLYTCIPDVLLFVNGLPWVVMEFKATGVTVRDAFDDNLTSYKHPQNGAPRLFASNAFLLVSNGTAAKVGSLTADWDRYFDWKRIASEQEPRRVSLEVLLRGTCDRERLFDLVRNFTLFSQHKTGLTKILGQNHQFLGVNNAIATTLQARAQGHGRAGVFWQTQGSGKSFAMVFYAQKILRSVPGNWTFVVVTDRVELDDQIAGTFAACGAVENAKACHAQSGDHLRRLLAENHRYVFTLIHKFTTADVLADRADVVVIVDEAHRSQYDQLAMNMRAALPRALFVAFTGTPLIAGEEKTREVFGDYVSVYDFQQSVEDNATVKLYYENRTPELHLNNPQLDDELHAVLDAASLDDASEARLEQLLGQKYHLITRDERLTTVADDIVQHFLGRAMLGERVMPKAMVVSIDKATALRMFDKVRSGWAIELARVRRTLAQQPTPVERAELEQRLWRLQTTDMAVVVSPGQNEIEAMKLLGIDIVPHRKRMVEEQPRLEDRFKDPKDPLALVFVCAMWLTGFDAPSCTTVYLDKPMRNHTLMQTITRANRVFPGKHSGLVVDYANVFASLKKALAIYGAGGGGKAPASDKDGLVGELVDVLAKLEAFCGSVGVDLAAIEACAASLQRLNAVAEAADQLLASEEGKKAFLAQQKLADRLYSALKPHKRAAAFAPRLATLGALAGKILEVTTPELQDIGEVLRQMAAVLDRSIDGASIAREAAAIIDLSRIDFRALAQKLGASRQKHLELERLKAAIAAQLMRLVAVNPTRVDFRARFEALIEEYNAGALQIEGLFQQLLDLTRSLSDEAQRHVREQLTETELVVFDLLTRPGPELSTPERGEVKKVVRKLLGRLQAILTVDWKKTNQARAQVRVAIEDELDGGLPRAYTPDMFKAKAGAVFEHVYESFGRSA
jgi:type I restriction enzyme R subunit